VTATDCPVVTFSSVTSAAFTLVALSASEYRTSTRCVATLKVNALGVGEIVSTVIADGFESGLRLFQASRACARNVYVPLPSTVEL
jgi:hypothetical protein